MLMNGLIPTKWQSTLKTLRLFFWECVVSTKLDNRTIAYLGTPLERKDHVKYLGVYFDEKMQWKNQLKNITQKANLKLGKIKSIS